MERLRFELLSEVGQGSYGKVFKAREVGGEERLLAVKKFNIHGDTSDTGIPAFMIREVALLCKMKHFNHPNIVHLDLTLVLEYIDQDLSTYLSKAPASGLSRDSVKDVMQQLLQGLDFLHTNMVLHRDLKPENILVSSQGAVKIADFGLARIYTFNIALTPGVREAAVVTLWYRAPEVLLHSVYMSSVDVWSAGCILAELFLRRGGVNALHSCELTLCRCVAVSCRPLFQAYTEVQQLQKIFEVLGLPSEEDWPEDSPISYSVSWGPKVSGTKLLENLGPEENDLLSQCLAFRPSSRISAAKALAHPFFTKH
ncbi:hypothetical protein INR49_011633 [Caranx melampygus]|nr:hypothetical protein INR49_011633 [Caranx melampygus]